MTTVRLSGASDDLVEVDGDIVEEFGYHDYEGHAGGDLVAFSDGTVLRIRHGEAWRITPVARGTATLAVEQAAESEDCGTDVATLTGDIRWAVHGIGWAAGAGASLPPARPTCDDGMACPAHPHRTLIHEPTDRD